MAVAAHRDRPDRRKARRGGCRGRRLRRAVCRIRSNFAANAAAAPDRERRQRGRREAAAGRDARSRRAAHCGIGEISGGDRLQPDRHERAGQAGRQGRFLLDRRAWRRPVAVCARLPAGGHRAAGVPARRRRNRLCQPAVRLGQCRAARPAGATVRQAGATLARRRGDASGPWGTRLQGSLRRRPGGKSLRRKHRAQRDRDPEPRRGDGVGANRCSRSGDAALYPARPELDGRALPGSGRHFRRQVRSGSGCRQDRADRLVRRRVERFEGDADRLRHAGGGNSCPPDRTGAAAELPVSPGLGSRRRDPVRRADRHRRHHRDPAGRGAAERRCRRHRDDHRDRRVLVRLPTRPGTDRPGLPDRRAGHGLSDRHATQLPPDRAASARDPPGLLALHVAALRRGARAQPGEAQARRRDQADHDHVLRHPRLHQPVGRAERGRAGAADQRIPDADDRHHHGASRHDR